MNARIFLSPPWMSGTELPLIGEAFASNYIAPCGPMVDRFEREFAAAVGLPHACALSSGTAALDLLFHELGVTRGDPVFCSDLTFVSSIAPAVHRGAVPVFIDCDAATWTMDPELLVEALEEAARKGRLPKVVVAADLYGQCCDYERIEAACAKFGVPLIVDAAEALGARYYGRSSFVHYCGSSLVGGNEVPKCGSSKVLKCNESNATDGSGFTNELMNSRTNELLAVSRQAGDAGWAAVYSFNGNKIITTSGGGMVASRDEGVVARARKRSQQAREPVAWYEHQELGYNYRMSNIVAAIGVGQLACLEQIIRKKRQIFEWYRQRLGTLAGFMPEAEYGTCTRWLTVVELGEGGGRRTEDGGDTASSNRQSAIGNRQAAMGSGESSHRGTERTEDGGQSAIGNRQSAIGKRQATMGSGESSHRGTERTEDGGRSSFVHDCDRSLVGQPGEEGAQPGTSVPQTNERMNSRTNELRHPSAVVERVRLALEAEDIESRPVWKPMHLQPVFRGAKRYGGAVSERLFANGLCLPSGAGLAEAEVDRVCAVVTRELAQSEL